MSNNRLVFSVSCCGAVHDARTRLPIENDAKICAEYGKEILQKRLTYALKNDMGVTNNSRVTAIVSKTMGKQNMSMVFVEVKEWLCETKIHNEKNKLSEKNQAELLFALVCMAHKHKFPEIYEKIFNEVRKTVNLNTVPRFKRKRTRKPNLNHHLRVA